MADILVINKIVIMNKRKNIRLVLLMMLAVVFLLPGEADARTKKKEQAKVPEIMSQWNGKKVAYLGDSITDANQLNWQNVFWNFLKDILGIEPYVYGINGHQMNQIIGQAEKLEAEHGQDVDAIIVFVGTNDYNAHLPIGEWYEEKAERTFDDGPIEVTRKHRVMNTDESTFCGRTNNVMSYLKHHFPTKQIIFLTPLHRGYATFGDKNIQPDESFANSLGYYIDDYVQAIREAGSLWAIPVIDLFTISGLYPLEKEQLVYFRNPDRDALHPNTEGHRRMAYAIAYQLLGYPASFDFAEKSE